jgi:hypothetical protein
MGSYPSTQYSLYVVSVRDHDIAICKTKAKADFFVAMMPRKRHVKLRQIIVEKETGCIVQSTVLYKG